MNKIKKNPPSCPPKKELYVFYSIYIFINAIVAYKYGNRQHIVNPLILTASYALFLCLIFFLNSKLKFHEATYKILFFTVSISFLLFSIWLNLHVDKFALQVDRWSAMEACIRALLHNQYPYSAFDHLMGQSSNLPALILLGIPFYLLGDVGYLQSFTFMVFLIIITISFKSYRVRFWALLTIIFSATYCYDIYVKSDIVSNFIIMLAFVVLSQKYFNKDQKKDLLFNSIGSALLMMTRIVTVIPLTLMFLKRFLKMDFKKKAYFTSVFIGLVILFFFFVFKNVGSMDNFMRYNPFYLQNSQLPFILSLVCVLLSIVYSFFVKSFAFLIKTCTLILLLTVLLSLLSKTIEFHGFYNSIINSRFDISYFNFVSPFLIFYLALLFEKHNTPDKLKSENSA